ncbi:MAG: cysteine desulfurase [Peptococcaceae bacterium]|nr:cysteine desulfurase [Peptococcaceae bacterium]
MRYVYLDHGATTPINTEVLNEMMPYLTDHFGNPSSGHAVGKTAREGIERARLRVAEGIGARCDEIVFTSGGSEADYLAIRGTAYANRHRGRHIITCAIEHPAVLETCRALSEEGYLITEVPVDRYGLVDPEQVRRSIRPDTILITIMLVNNEVGTIQPVKEIAHIGHQYDIIVHSDAVQAVGKIPVDVNELGVDLLSLSAHKLYGPKGAGALYIRRDTPWQPLNRGGGQEGGRRPGTENVPGIVGLGKAVELAVKSLSPEAKRLSSLRDYIVERTLGEIPGTSLNGHRLQRVPHNAHFLIEGVDGKELLTALNKRGIAVSGGAACHAGTSSLSHVLQAMIGCPAGPVTTLRVTLGSENTANDAAFFVDTLKELVLQLRKT